MKSVFFFTLRIFKYKTTAMKEKKCRYASSFSKRSVSVSEKLVLCGES
jgi:hypothetical protein